MLDSRSAPSGALQKYPAAHFNLVDVVATVWDDAPVPSDDDFCLLVGGGSTTPEPQPAATAAEEHQSVISEGIVLVLLADQGWGEG